VSRFERAARPATLDPTDEWILAELNELTAACALGYRGFDFFGPSNKIRDFVWNLFAPHYLEMAKRRAYAGDASARWTLHEVLRSVLLMLAPIAPFLPYIIYRQLYAGDVHLQRLPEPVPGVDASLREKTPLVSAFNSEVWKRKKEQNLALSQPIVGIDVPSELAPMRAGLVAMHNLQS
jgi:valyl-tRNA synthetase